MNTIHLRPMGGLANRLRAWASARWAADQHGLDLVVSWGHQVYMPATWNDLFEDRLPAPDPGVGDRPTVRLRNPTLVDLDAPDIRQADVLELETNEAFTTHPDVVAMTSRFWAEVRPYLIGLTPVSEVRELVRHVTGRFGPAVLGAHLRIGGGAMHFKTPNRLTPESLMEEVDRLTIETPGHQVYLATDTDSVVPAFRDRYGADLIVMDDHVEPGFRTFDSVRNIRIALAETIILSRTHRLLGSFFSSFAMHAGALGAIPYLELGKPDGKKKWLMFRETP